MLRLRKNKHGKVEADLRSVLGHFELPTFPKVVLDTLDAIRHPHATAAAIAAPMSADPGLTVRLLSLVNSPAYGPSRPITSVEQAVAMAGVANVESIVLAVGVAVASPSQNVEGLDHDRYWRAAARRAAIARAFAQELHPQSAGLAFTAGLLQDMAIPFLAVARSDYRPLLTEWHGGGDDLHELEASEFGWTHGEVAKWLCAEWKLPEELSIAIAGHHDESAIPGVRLAAPFRELDIADDRELVIAQATADYGMAADDVAHLISVAESDAVEVAQLLL